MALLLCGCQAGDEKTNTTDMLYKEYQMYVQKLDEHKDFSSDTKEFSLKVVTNTTNKGNYRYDVIIDNPTIAMYNIKVVASVSDSQTTSYPTLGILEEETFALIPGVVDKTKNIYKGINLSGISSEQNAVVKVYITYTKSKEDEKQEERFIQV